MEPVRRERVDSKAVRMLSGRCETSDSASPLMDLRAVRQVWTTISGDSSRRRT